MRYAIIENNVVINVAESDEPFTDEWVLSDTANIGDTWDGLEFITPPKINQTILGILSTDVWTIPADSLTVATVTYTDTDTVYFSVNETTHAVEPVDNIATLEITANAPGLIRVEVKDKQLIITAIEVPL